MTIAQHLRAAADLIEKHGHAKHTYGDSSCGYCAIGAITAAWPMCMNVNPVVKVLSDHIGRSVSNWNDEPERTGEEVVAAMRAAADAWETLRPTLGDGEVANA